MKVPVCQMCHSNRKVVLQGVSGEVYWCKGCRCLVDTEPDRDRIFSPHNNPAKAAEIMEARSKGGRLHG